MKNPYIYKVKGIKKIVDGDTVDLIVDIGYHIFVVNRYRVDGYDTPEHWRPVTEAERVAAIKCTEYISKLLNDNLDILWIESLGLEKWGRWRGRIFIEETKDNFINVADLMIKYMEENHYTKEEVRKLP